MIRGFYRRQQHSVGPDLAQIWYELNPQVSDVARIWAVAVWDTIPIYPSFPSDLRSYG